MEQLGSGIPRILEHYGKERFGFSDNSLRMTFPVKETTVKGGVMGGLKGGQVEKIIDAIPELTHRR